ncbi:MAG TPA: hypothetical protein QGF58_23765 [Myxococcota bacterium]|nr:hypothetical protein [Myxococcota bacterium]
MKETWGESELIRLWAYGAGSDSSGARWRDDHAIEAPILIDTDSSIRQAYFMGDGMGDAFAMNPRHFVIDRDGLLRYAGANLDPDEEDAVIAAALAAGSE